MLREQFNIRLKGAKIQSAFFLGGLRIKEQRAGESVKATRVEKQRDTHIVTEN